MCSDVASQVVAALLERAAERRGRSASEEAIGAGVVSHLIAGVMPNIVLPENEADEAEPPGMSLRWCPPPFPLPPICVSVSLYLPFPSL